MRKSEAAKYARWSAAVAMVFAGLTVGVYLKRGWTRHVEKKNAPAAAPVNVERQSTGLMFSKGEGTQKVFTVEASKSIDFKGLNASDLEGVKITIFGKDGARHDTMETHTCRYTKDSGDIICSGDVEILLMSAEQWKAAAGKPGAHGTMKIETGTMKIETKGMAFNRASGEARTDAEVKFSFAEGTGDAIGAEYQSEAGTLRLQKNVKLRLDSPATAKGKTSSANAKKEPVIITGTRMDFARDARTMLLSGPAEASTPSQRLTAAALLLELDTSFHAQRLIAKSGGKEQRPEFSAAKGEGKEKLSADEIVATFAPQGWVTHAEATGEVRGESERGEETQSVNARNATIEMVPGQNAPKLMVLTGAVDARMKTGAKGPRVGGDSRRLTSEELRLEFAEEQSKKGTRLVAARTPSAGRIEWNEEENASAKAAQTVVLGNELGLQFDGAGKPSRLDAKGNVQTERSVAGAEKQTATAKNGFMELQPAGGWLRMELNENVKLNEGARAAQADHAVFARADQSVTLTGHARARDASTLTSAQKLTFWQTTGEVRGEGGVRSSDLSARAGAVHLAPVAANVSADQLNGNSKTGRGLYSGHARFWQGDSVLEAESIELLKNERKANAAGNVRAVFAQAPGNADGSASAAGAARKPPALWHAQSARLTYWDQENRARMEQNVTVQSAEQRINADTLDLYFTRANSGTNIVSGIGPGSGAGSDGAAANGAGAQQISRAVGNGKVMVQQGDRRATAEHGEYSAADGKFVMTGGTPTLFDASEGTTIGRQLTFFLADATIIVDSENGSRTLTKHRVEK